MKKIAIAGVGGIGGNIGGYLALGGQDVTLICMTWRENAEAIRRNGLTLVNPEGKKQVSRPAVLFADELPQFKDKFNILFICMSSNETVTTLNKMMPFLAEDCWIISPQNGINEDLIIPIAGEKNVIACVSYTGGGFISPGVVSMHDGYYVIGELDGKITPRVEELSRLLSMVVPVRISTGIMQERWHKLCIAAMVGTVSEIYGFNFGFLRGVFQNEKTRQVLARFVNEIGKVAAAAGHKLDTVENIKVDDWVEYAAGHMPELCAAIETAGAHFPDNAPGSLLKTENEYRRTFSYEMEHINGYIIKKGRELGIPTPVNEIIVSMIKDIESGKLKPGLDNVDRILEMTSTF